jgi:uncharacterized membrane protein
VSPTLLLLLRAAHVLGVILWIGGTVTAALIVAFGATDATAKLAAAARRAVLLVATPGLLLAWVAGLTVLLSAWPVYQSAGWMHAKLTVALIVTALTGVVTGRLRRAAGGADAKPGLLRGMAVGILVLAALVLLLARLQPF